MTALRHPRPTHLGIFLTDATTGQPCTQVPLFAEVALPSQPPVVAPDDRFLEPIRSALQAIDPDVQGDLRDRVEAAVAQALSNTLDTASRDLLASQNQPFDRLVDFFSFVFKETLRSARADHFADVSADALAQGLAQALQAAAQEMNLGLVVLPPQADDVWANPLGVLTTDHVGYVSFDLTRLRPDVYARLAQAMQARREGSPGAQAVAIWVYPQGSQQRWNALAQGRFAQDAVVARFAVNAAALPQKLQHAGTRALQNPSLTDWRLSAASFAASPKTLIGEDGCEELVPANVALQEFVLRQVVRLSDAPPGTTVPAPYKPAYVDEYKVSWFSLGHSLGEILYSLPLAPAETVKLAVIDWSWDSLVQRNESTKLSESVLHQTHRDRLITETVKAGLREMQTGSSFMGGVATSVGASGTIGVVSGAAGNAWSLGGSTATSSGSRDLAAENVQRLNDSFAQASSSLRELNSTVVVQARQEEKESIQTRTFTNYNHAHTLTVLYYEVLRHYRVTVEWMRRRPAALIRLPERIGTFDAAVLMGRRHVLEPALLDASLKPAFDLLEKQETIREHQSLHGVAPRDAVPNWWEGDIQIALFEFGLKTAEGLRDKTDELVMVNLILVDGANVVSRPLLQTWEKASMTADINVGDRLDDTAMGWFVAKPDRPVPWSQLAGFEFILHDSDEWRMDRLAINAFHSGGVIPLLENLDVDFYFPDNGSSNTITFFKRPGPRPPMQPPILNPERSLAPEEHHQVKKLLAHFALYADHYNRVILLQGSDPNTIATRFEKEPWMGGQSLADAVDPTPLEVFGSYVAYPLARNTSGLDDTLVVDLAAALNGNDAARQQWALDQLARMDPALRERAQELIALASAKSERLVTLPTRGVFAEGKLGHCSVAEEIDNTRFWKWEEHPIPFEAPGIGDVVPIQPQPQAINVAPTPFPQSLVNIVNPSPAPDPMGLSAALALLGTPNIFRDMSGRQEVADLLKKLSDNTISIAEAANQAKAIQTKYGTDLDKQQKDYDLGVTNAAAGVEGKAIEADARRAEAQAARAEAEAKKSNVEAATAQAEAAKNLPKPLREPVYKAAAQALAGDPVKNKAVVFKAMGFDGQVLAGEFGLAMRDVLGQADVIAENKVGPYFSRNVSFSTADPVVDARARRTATASIKILDQEIFLPAVDAVSAKDSYTVGKSHRVINISLVQGAREVSFKSKTTNGAVDELMNKWGVELGVDKVVAAKMVAAYENKNQITHATEEEKSYTFRVPTQNYDLNITSH